MTEQEVQDIVGGLGQQIAALSIDLAAARATIARLERELADGRAEIRDIAANSDDG